MSKKVARLYAMAFCLSIRLFSGCLKKLVKLRFIFVTRMCSANKEVVKDMLKARAVSNLKAPGNVT